MATLNNQSLATLIANIPASSLLTVFGLQSAIVNVIVVAVIAKSHNLHNKCFFLMANLAATDFLIGK